jgi:hypothetical protein
MYTDYQSQFWAHALTLKSASDSVHNLSRSIANAKVDLNPHQVDAALFAFRSPLTKGAILADEVGLGKTIEAGIVLAQRWAERRRRILLILPATLRKQWQQEIEEKFFLPTVVLESRNFNQFQRDGHPNPFEQDGRIVACSYHFASAKSQELRRVNWDLVVIDEAHRLRNVYKPGNKMARNIADAVGSSPKLLLTATPLQNSLMELYGLVSIIDPHVFGDAASFREKFVRTNDEEQRNTLLKERLKPLCQGEDRDQVLSPDWKPLQQLNDIKPLHPLIRAVAQGSFRQKQPPVIRGSGWVVESLEASLWAFYNADTFEEAVFRAVNLGDDADTTGAICGQLAGAFWGESKIPESLRSDLAQIDMLEKALAGILGR